MSSLQSGSESLQPDASTESFIQATPYSKSNSEFGSDYRNMNIQNDTDSDENELDLLEKEMNETETETERDDMPMDLTIRPRSTLAGDIAPASTTPSPEPESTDPPEVNLFNFDESQEEEEIEFQDFGEAEDAEPMCQIMDFRDEDSAKTDETQMDDRFLPHVPENNFCVKPRKSKYVKVKLEPQEQEQPTVIEENVIMCNPFEFCADGPDHDNDTPLSQTGMDENEGVENSKTDELSENNLPELPEENLHVGKRLPKCKRSIKTKTKRTRIRTVPIEQQEQPSGSGIEENVILCNPFEFCVSDPDPDPDHDHDMDTVCKNNDKLEENQNPSKIHDEGILHDDNLFVEAEPSSSPSNDVMKIKSEPVEQTVPMEENVILCNPYEFCVSDPGPGPDLDLDAAEPEVKLNHCEPCDRTFTNQVYLEIHIQRVHTGEKLYECNMCHARYNGPLHFIPHMKRHNPLFDEVTTNIQEFIKYLCGHCHEAFTTMMSMNEHNDQVHDGKAPEIIEKPHICQICGKAFRKTQKLNDHVRIHTGEITHSCDICGKGFSRKDKLTLHTRVHTGEKPYKCEYCDKLYPYSSTLSRHIQMFHKEEDAAKKALEELMKNPRRATSGSSDPLSGSSNAETNPLTCEICDRSFSTKATLKKHNLNVHTGETPYECDICHAKYKYFKSLGDHMKSHTGEKLYKCKVCSEVFYHWSTLNAHKQTQHTGVTPYHCQHCSFSFATTANLDEHTQKYHKGEAQPEVIDKPHKCTVCGKGFMVSARLTEHMRIHTGEKSHSCELCGKSFLRKDALNAHKRVHTGEKPYHCEHCNMGFVRKATLNKHLLTHNNGENT